MNWRIFVIIIVGITILVWLLVFNQTKTIKVEKERETHEEPQIMEKKEPETKRIEIVTLYDNYQVDQKLKTGWGFSCLIRQSLKDEGESNILFDTGADSLTLLSNMEKLEIKPASIDKIVISHIHGDHLGGLEGFLRENNNVEVFIPNSFPDSIRKVIKNSGADFIDVSKPQKISESIYTTGKLSGPPEEQSLVILSEKGLIIISGCAHPGIVNIVKKAKEMFPGEEVYLVLGGFHFPPLSVVKEFRELKVKKVAPSHCTGDLAREAFKKEYKDDFIENGVGKIIEI